MNPKPDHPASPHQTEVEAARIRLPRRTLLGVAAAVALGAGATVAWIQRRKAAESAVTSAVPDFWALEWTTPDGASLPMQSFQGRPLLVNFWATWCPPCVEELPLINAFYQENKGKGWQVLGLAVDKPERVQSFLKASPLSFALGMAGLEGTELSRELGNLTGSLPFTVVFASDGSIAQRKLGRISQQDLDQWRGLR